MRSAVDAILKFNSGFDAPSLARKLMRMSSSCFVYFRGTYHLFASDMLEGPFRKWPAATAAGPIVGDLHTENFGTFRAATGNIVYDINDFDETTEGPYEFDLRRMATALVLAALDSGHTFSGGVLLAETYLRAYLEALGRMGQIKQRREFEKLHDHPDVHQALSLAAEKSRVEMMKTIAVEAAEGKFAFRPAPDHFRAAGKTERKWALAGLPEYKANCLMQASSRTRKFELQDIVFRYAGCGSLGRGRYALLLSKGKGPAGWETLRLAEWKDALDSALTARRPRQSKNRAKEVVERTIAFQLFPKRMLGYTRMDGRPMQAREIGANDARFPHREFTDPARFHNAAKIFGKITARDHLLASLAARGPRALSKEILGSEDRFVYRLLAFAAAYTVQTMDDYAEFQRRRAEIARAWKAKG